MLLSAQECKVETTSFGILILVAMSGDAIELVKKFSFFTNAAAQFSLDRCLRASALSGNKRLAG
jgi:hypothetical protein